MSEITINEVRRRLQLFALEHQNDSDEKQHAQQFWRDFYMCFGLSKSSASMFEKRVLKINGTRGYIDSFIPSILLVEQKSLGKDLSKAYEQARDYFYAIENEFEKPQYIITCDFQTFHLYDLHEESKEPHICKLAELHKRADWFMFLVDEKVVTVSEETPVNRKAAEQVSKLHDGLMRANYVGKDLEIFLTRLLFCLFADDTGIFGSDGQFRRLIEKTKEDGSDVGSTIALLFQVLNTPKSNRQTNLDENLNAFEYVNGSLFSEYIQTPYFDFDLRANLLRCIEIDWSGISPAIFGSMFQSVLEYGATDNLQRNDTRRELGAHYTSERNILKVIEPLFLDELRNEYEQAKGNKTKLTALYDKLPKLKFFDPACGCGNFLVIAYKELRHIENDVINELFFKGEKGLLDISTLCRVNVGQFYGIEIDEAATHIARVAMYITDHQLNLDSANKFGKTRATIPLTSSPQIHCANALRINWNDVLKAENCNYVFGNPPFIGKQNQSASQKSDLEFIGNKINKFGLLDYVSCWYIKALEYIFETNITVAFVSTNSITQGEQVAVLWSWLVSKGIKINFAHRTFKWNNEGRGVAGVHCIIVGFSLINHKIKKLFNYKNDADEPVCKEVSQINPYLVDAPPIVLDAKREPICKAKPIVFGNMANDGGYLFLNDVEKQNIIKDYPLASKFIKKFLGADEFINNLDRWCIWLNGINVEEFRHIVPIYNRIQKVKEHRLNSSREATKKLAATPYLFAEIRQTKEPYVLIPRHSSENRKYIPIGFFDADTICGDANCMIPNASLYDFAILTSRMHMAWVNVICGRLESRYRYSNTIVYNNFVWPDKVSEALNQKIFDSAQRIIDARNLYKNASLADLYDDLTMPVELLKAHQENNKLVDDAFGYKDEDDDSARVAFLLKKYIDITSIFPLERQKKKQVKRLSI